MTSSSDGRRPSAVLRSDHATLRPAGFATAQLTTTSRRAADDDAATDRAWRAAHDAGYQAGLLEAAGEQAAWRQGALHREDAERAARAQQWSAVLASLGAAVDGAVQSATVADVQATAAHMAVEIAEALVGHHLQVADCAALDAVTRALADVPRGSDITVRLNPDDSDLAPGSLEDLTAGCAVELVADPAVEPGGAVVTIGDRTVDAQLGAALSRVREVLSR